MGIVEHWKARLKTPGPKSVTYLCAVTLSADDLGLLRASFWPRDIEERWVIWLDGGRLRCWRSWTAMCVYEADVRFDGDQGEVVRLTVVDDIEAYRCSDNAVAQIDRFEAVLDLVRSRDPDEDRGFRLVTPWQANATPD